MISFKFKWPIICQNVCILDLLGQLLCVDSINRINQQKCHQKKLTWMTSMKHLKMVDWQAGRKVQVRRLSHARHGMEKVYG